MTNEYWRITELKKLLEIQRESKLNSNVTRSEENDLQLKIKLLQMGIEEGRKEHE